MYTKRDIINLCDDLNGVLPKNCWWVSYKAAMVLYGIVDSCRDLDICGTKEVSEHLEHLGIKPETTPLGGKKYNLVSTGLIEFYETESRNTNRVYGINVEKASELLELYKSMNRDKDRETIKLLHEYLL